MARSFCSSSCSYCRTADLLCSGTALRGNARVTSVCMSRCDTQPAQQVDIRTCLHDMSCWNMVHAPSQAARDERKARAPTAGAQWQRRQQAPGSVAASALAGGMLHIVLKQLPPTARQPRAAGTRLLPKLTLAGPPEQRERPAPTCIRCSPLPGLEQSAADSLQATRSGPFRHVLAHNMWRPLELQVAAQAQLDSAGFN